MSDAFQLPDVEEEHSHTKSAPTTTANVEGNDMAQ